MARAAPSSSSSRPWLAAAWASQSWRARGGRRSPGAKYVPRRWPSSTSRASAALATTVGIPASVAIMAASTLVAIPPVPTATVPPAPARPRVTPARSARLRTSVIRRAPGWRGSVSYSASTSDSRISAPARTTCATSAASRSLSPNRISSVATVSFSFTMGRIPSSSSRLRVRWAFR